MTTAPARYRAFISYSHRDSTIVGRLHRRLESWVVPRALRGVQPDGRVIAPRLHPIFRDRDELASSTCLSRSIEEALEASAALIVVCSPAAVASPWVDQEIAYFRRCHPQRPVLAFVVAGDPGVDPRNDAVNAAFPPSLLLSNVDDPDSSLGEPVAADARESADGFSAAFLKLVAGLLDVRYDQLRRRELRRRQQRWAALAGVASVLATVFAVLAVQATLARNQAQAAQAVAELELQSERQTRDFLLSIFHLADANEARGNSVTVREVLDRAVARIDHTRFSRPAIRSRFLATMGQAYSSLGLNQRSVELLDQSAKVLAGQTLAADVASQRMDSLIEMANVLYTMGEYDRATAALDSLGTSYTPTPLQRAHMDNVRGDVLAYTEHDEEAKASYAEALTALAPMDPKREDVVLERSRSLSGSALLDQFSGKFAEAERGYTAVVELLTPVVGPTHPETVAAEISRGSCAYQNRDSAAARAAWTRALESAKQVYDTDSPQIGTIKNNLGLLLLETGDLHAAEPLLRDALASDRKYRSAEFDDLVFPLFNLASIRFVQSDSSEAAALLAEAQPIAEKARHRMLGPILSMQADLDCAAEPLQLERAQRGLALAERAVTAGKGHDDVATWYQAQANLTVDYCRARSGGKVDPSGLPQLLETMRGKWAAGSPFVQRAQAQLASIRSTAKAANQP